MPDEVLTDEEQETQDTVYCLSIGIPYGAFDSMSNEELDMLADMLIGLSKK